MNTPKRNRALSEKTLSHARELRRNMTPAERILWKHLRAHNLAGFKFRRQHPIGDFITDFCSVESGLVIEIDGDTHAGREQQDAWRTAQIESKGYRVIRFTNEDVHQRLAGVLEEILKACAHAHPQPLPPGGGNTTWNASLYDTKHNFVYKFGEDVLDLLEIAPGMRVLDVGCGTGYLTAKLTERGAQVVGLDNSISMIDKARAAYPNVQFIAADASDFSVETPFDAIFSNAALHWVLRAEEAARCMVMALRPGGQFVIEMGGKGNVSRMFGAIRDAVRETTGAELTLPWYFPSVAEYAGLLEKYGIEVRAAWLFDRPTPLEGEDGARNWYAMFGGSLLKELSADEREKAITRAENALHPTMFKDGVWQADYRRLRIVGVKK